MSPFCAGKCLDEEEIARRQNTRKRGSMKAEPAKLQMPLAAVTAIIPAYNEAANIEATIRSIQSQTYHVTQVIVVDDCSTDGTGDIARELGATVLRPPRNTGSKAAAQSYALPYVQTKFCVAIATRSTRKHGKLKIARPTSPRCQPLERTGTAIAGRSMRNPNANAGWKKNR